MDKKYPIRGKINRESINNAKTYQLTKHHHDNEEDEMDMRITMEQAGFTRASRGMLDMGDEGRPVNDIEEKLAMEA